MKLLLDTCALLWLGGDSSRLTVKAREALVQARGEIHVSAISALEIAIKFSKRRLELPTPPGVWYPRVLERYGLQEVPVTGSIALRAPHHLPAASSLELTRRFGLRAARADRHRWVSRSAAMRLL